MADGTVHLPVAGNVKKTYVYVAGAVVLAIVGVAYFRHKKNQAASSTTSTAASTDPNAVDPATGLTYAEEASQQGGYMYGDVGYNTYGSGGGYSTYPYPSNSISSQAGQYTTNQDWLAAAEGVVPGDPNTVALALTRVLGGLGVTQAQIDIFHEATGILGQQPPQGYPPIKLVTSGGPGTGGGSGGGSSGGGASLPAPSGLHVVSTTASEIHVAWNAVKGATDYQIQVVPKDAKGHGIGKRTSYVAGGLHPRTHYTIHVSSHPGGPSSSTSATTK